MSAAAGRPNLAQVREEFYAASRSLWCTYALLEHSERHPEQAPHLLRVASERLTEAVATFVELRRKLDGGQPRDG